MGIKSMAELRQNIDLVRRFQPMTTEEQSAFLGRVRNVATDGRYELFKSGNTFDGPHHKRQHGFATA